MDSTGSYTYNGLGLRLTKSDPSGNYAYFTDGTSPASDVLSDNFTTFTPGTSETKGIGNGQYASLFYLPDASGNSRGLLNSTQAATDGYNWDAFGTLMSRNGGNPTGYAWGEGSGYQSDNDTGLKLLGHRYYDARIGRFISQDPAGDGDNWYAYAGNDPVDEVDPDGLTPTVNIEGWSPVGSPGYSGVNAGAQAFDDYTQSQGYWTRGAPTGAVNGQPTISAGEVPTYWVPGSININGMSLAEELTLPLDPSGLPGGWQPDSSHQAPGGSRHRGPGGEGLDFHKGRPGQPGFEGKDHWHKLRLNGKGKWETDPTVGKRGHLLPGDVVKWGVVGAIGYGLYEGVKWGGAILLAPETGGLSLGGAALVP